jgi:hypothetical protein
MNGVMEASATLQGGSVWQTQVRVVQMPGFLRIVSEWGLASDLESRPPVAFLVVTIIMQSKDAERANGTI